MCAVYVVCVWCLCVWCVCVCVRACVSVGGGGRGAHENKKKNRSEEILFTLESVIVLKKWKGETNKTVFNFEMIATGVD